MYVVFATSSGPYNVNNLSAFSELSIACQLGRTGPDRRQYIRHRHRPRGTHDIIQLGGHYHWVPNIEFSGTHRFNPVHIFHRNRPSLCCRYLILSEKKNDTNVFSSQSEHQIPMDCASVALSVSMLLVYSPPSQG